MRGLGFCPVLGPRLTHGFHHLPRDVAVARQIMKGREGNGVGRVIVYRRREGEGEEKRES